MGRSINRKPPRKFFSKSLKSRRMSRGLHHSKRRRLGVPTTSPRSFRGVVFATIGILRRSGLKYMVTGGVALPFYGRVRTTTDIDIIVEHDEEKLKLLVEELNRAGFTVPWEWVEQSLKEKTHFTVQDTLSPYRLDIKMLEPGENLGRSIEVKLYGQSTHITAPEELVLHKLRFASDADIEDARSIIIRHGKRLAVKYMLRKASELSVRDELIKLLRDENIKVE